MMLGQGRAAAISNDDMAALARELGCHPASLEAIAEVESNGFGWFDDGRIKILPEPHKFDDYLPAARRAEARRLGLATLSYAATKASGHYKRMTNGPGPRYALLARMIAFDENAAFNAISVGRFQIMGFNHAVCGYRSAKAMFEAFVDSEANQLRAFGRFLVDKKLKDELVREDFDGIERGYNGGGLNGVYARRMRTEAARLKRGKWAKWPESWPGKGVTIAPPPMARAEPVSPPPPPPPPAAPEPSPVLPPAAPRPTPRASWWSRLWSGFFTAAKGP
ncbi:MAG: hypothetical protein B7Z40_15665 [Bosea sp. 12-68-7]|nr:MAG: hypothetical protein B7Z40_15665 [Bosea sp. 12-68-7]OYX00742.1 MAG: hypothetical protein B7Z14_08165 [Bosea sp. 32-68-6]